MPPFRYKMTTFLSTRYHNKVSEGYRRFCDGTSVHGFHDLYYAKTVFWKVLWWIVLLFACGITVYHIFYATREFIDQHSVTQVVPPDKGHVVYPTLGICYAHWIYWMDWNKAGELGFNKYATLYGLSYMGKIFSSEEFDLDVAKRDFLKAMDKNGFKYLTEFYDGIARSFPLIIGSFPTFPVLQTDPFIFKTKRVVYKEGGYQFCYTVSGEEIAKVLNERDSSSNSRMSRNLFNFSVRDPSYKYYAKDITFEEYNYYMAYWLCFESNYWLSTLADFERNYTWFVMPRKLYLDINSEEFVILKVENDKYNVKMTPTVQRLRNTWQKPCLANQSAMSTDQACNFKCKAKRDNENSFCTYIDEASLYNTDTTGLLCRYPINFLRYKRENPDFAHNPCDNFIPEGSGDTLRRTNMTLGPDMLLQTVNIDAQLESEYEECSKKCPSACEIWKYSVTVNILVGNSVAQANSFKNQTDINVFYPREEDVLIVVDKDSLSWEIFIANVGGLLGVWTGATMVTFLQLPYLCCFSDKDLTNVCRPKRKRTTQQNKNGVNLRKTEKADIRTNETMET